MDIFWSPGVIEWDVEGAEGSNMSYVSAKGFECFMFLSSS